MNPKIKYWLEDNKDKMYIGGAAMTVLAASVGGYLFFDRDQGYNAGEDVEISMASHLLTQRGDGDLELLSIEENKAISTMALNEDAVVFRGENLDALHTYQEGKVYTVGVSEEGALDLVDGKTMPEIEGVLSAQTNGDVYGFLTEDELIVADALGETLLVFEERATDTFQLANEGIYLAIDNEIHYVSYDEETTHYIDIGDTTTRFSKHGNTIVARNNFGSGEGIESVLNFEDGSLVVDDLKRMPFDDKIDVLVPQNENQLVYVQTLTDSEDVLTRQDLATIAIQTDSENDEDVDLSDFTLPMETTEAFAWYKTLASNGFVYDWTESGVRIIEMRNGREVTRVSAHSEEAQLFVPIYND